MPVLWTVSHSTRSVVISAKGVVRLEDMEECVRGIVVPATLSYSKLIDLTEAELTLDREGIVAIAEFTRARRGTGPTGALAIVVGSEAAEREAQLFDSLTAADRPSRVFRDRDEARRWLAAQPAPRLPDWLEDVSADEAA